MVVICDLHVIYMGIAACDLYVGVVCDLWVYGICYGSLCNVWETLCTGTYYPKWYLKGFIYGAIHMMSIILVPFLIPINYSTQGETTYILPLVVAQ